MKFEALTKEYAVSAQIQPADVPTIAASGYAVIINNRPDGEAVDQPPGSKIEAAAKAAGMDYYYLPVAPTDEPIAAEDLARLDAILAEARGRPVLAFCRTGNRSRKIYAQAATARRPSATGDIHHQVLIVGGGAGGIATAASLLKRDSALDIAIVEPRDQHYYQPGWTMVGGGIFKPSDTIRPIALVIPHGVKRITGAVDAFEPTLNRVVLESGAKITYDYLVVAAGIKLDWDAVEGLSATLGKNGVTSNYDIRYAPYTWQLVNSMKKGRAVFTQPPMPIKCAGAPQKALYLSADHWLKQGALKDIQIDFYNAGGVLFGVPDYVPALEHYMQKYRAHIHFSHNLVAVDGPAGKAWFATPDSEERVEVEFDLLHVSPPQCAPDFISQSPLANEAGWLEVDQATLMHPRYHNVFGLGDVTSTPNAKTAAAVRKQAPVVAHNVLRAIRCKQGQSPQGEAHYDGYGSCPLTVERGKVVLAEFGYGGKILPSVPAWMLNGKRPTTMGWMLKAHLLRPIYHDLMLKGVEWLAKPQIVAGGSQQ